ncbi:MAG: hypothetical protein WCV80_01410 [Candidatus Paceibacterota bacterium]|jgi:hypothetical protein
MDITKCIQSKKFKAVLSIVGIFIVAILIFQAGMFIGYKKAAFSYGWGERYYKAFGGPRGMPMMQQFPRGGFPDAHGASGRILQLSLPTFVIEGRDGIEKVVVIKDDTIVRRFRETIQATELKVGDSLVVIGAPNEQSQVEAKLIRLLPSDEMREIETLKSR